MNLAENIFSRNRFFEENSVKNFEKSQNSAQIIFFPVVFRRHHVLNDPVNLIDRNGQSPVMVGAGAVMFFLGFYFGQDPLNEELVRDFWRDPFKFFTPPKDKTPPWIPNYNFKPPVTMPTKQLGGTCS